MLQNAAKAFSGGRGMPIKSNVKRLFLVLALLLNLSLVSNAADQRFYGAWWATILREPGVAKPAGSITFVVHEQTGIIYWSDRVVDVTISTADGEVSYQGYWEQSVFNPNVVFLRFETTPATINYSGPAFTVKFNRLSGALAGSFRTSLMTAKVQATRQ
jgi:hypothetical protein